MSPGPAASSSTRYPGCSASCVDHPRRDRHPPARGPGRRGWPHPAAARSHMLERSRPAARRDRDRGQWAPSRPDGRVGRPEAIAERAPRSGRSAAAGRSPCRASVAIGRSRCTDCSISGQRCDAACRPAGTASTPREEHVHERRRDDIAVALDLVEHRERAVERHPALDDSLGDREQRGLGTSKRPSPTAPGRRASAPSEHLGRLLGAHTKAAAELGERERLRSLGRRRRSAPRLNRPVAPPCPRGSSSSRLMPRG